MSKIKNIAGAVHIARKAYQHKDQIKEMVGHSRDSKKDVFDRVEDGAGVISRMFRAIVNGKYKFPLKTILYMVGGLLYFVSPIDFIPDFILGIGFLDDITVIGLVIKRVFKEVKRFKDWESSQAVSTNIVKL